MASCDEEIFYVDAQYICEWINCQFVTDTLQEYEDHVSNHGRLQLVTQYNSNALKCQWNGCGEEITAQSQFILHLSFHSYHAKLMAWGRLALIDLNNKNNSNYICKLSSSSRNVIPELPEYFECLWKTCPAVRFDNITNFYNHVETHAPKSTKTTIITCQWEDCNVESSHRSHFKAHLRSHSKEKILSCPTCGSMFTDRYKYVDHIMRQYTKQVSNVNEESDEIFTCQPCGKGFATKRIYDEHVKSHKSTHDCPKCTYVANGIVSLKKHMLYKHTDERNFSCDQCSSKFKTSSDLRKHIKTHNSEETFKCSSCSFVGKSSRVIDTHNKRVHGVKVGETYKCQLCEVTFQRANSLTRHLSRKHEIKLPEGKSRFTFEKYADGFVRAVIDFIQ